MSSLPLPPPPPHIIEASRRQWSDFDFSGHLRSIQDTLGQAKDAREQSLVARKSLAETTKQFKKAVKSLEQAVGDHGIPATTTTTTASPFSGSVDGLGKLSRSMVKSYQEEVDQLTRRCKSMETAYQNLGTDLSKLSDPAVALQSSLDHMAQYAQTLEAMQRDLEAAQSAAAAAAASAGSSAATTSAAVFGPSSSSSGAVAGPSREEREELLQLRREVAEYEVEFRSLKNQDITIRKLESKIVELQSSAHESMSLQLEQAKRELAETEGRRAVEALEREAAMERKVQALELQLRAERAGREATQAHLLQADEGVSQREAAWEAQKRILVEDGERLREQLHVVTAERDDLSLRVAAASSANNQNKAAAPGSGGGMGGGGGAMTPPASGGVTFTDLMLERKAYEAEVAELSETTSLLRDELKAKEEGLATERRASTMKIQGLERNMTEMSAKIVELETRLARAPHPDVVDSMRRELRILKRLEYNAADDADDGMGDDHDPEIAGVNEDAKDLESVLVAKLRRVESDLVTERTSRAELRQEVEHFKVALTEAEKAKSELEKLVSSLERDLEMAIATPAPAQSRTSSSRTLDIVPTDGSPSTLQQVLDPDSAPPSDSESRTHPLPPPPMPQRSASVTAQERADDDHSVATIVMAQRDRLRARCEALEAERDSFKQELQAQVQASESLKSDNTKLYEKVRYLQTYSNKQGPAAAQQQRGSAYHRGSAVGGDRDLDLEALEQRYEASVDPFRQFSRAERQRKLNEMSPMERTVFLVAKTFLATKEMRTALFIYVLAMHLLVFITTYHWSHAGGCHNAMDMEHLSHLPPALPVDMQQQPLAVPKVEAAP